MEKLIIIITTIVWILSRYGRGNSGNRKNNHCLFVKNKYQSKTCVLAMLLRTRHQQLYMHTDHIEHATASTILYTVNNISRKFLSKAVENIESVKKEVQENDEYEVIRDMEESTALERLDSLIETYRRRNSNSSRDGLFQDIWKSKQPQQIFWGLFPKQKMASKWNM